MINDLDAGIGRFHDTQVMGPGEGKPQSLSNLRRLFHPDPLCPALRATDRAEEDGGSATFWPATSYALPHLSSSGLPPLPPHTHTHGARLSLGGCRPCLPPRVGGAGWQSPGPPGASSAPPLSDFNGMFSSRAAASPPYHRRAVHRQQPDGGRDPHELVRRPQ